MGGSRAEAVVVLLLVKEKDGKAAGDDALVDRERSGLLMVFLDLRGEGDSVVVGVVPPKMGVLVG